MDYSSNNRKHLHVLQQSSQYEHSVERSTLKSAARQKGDGLPCLLLSLPCDQPPLRHPHMPRGVSWCPEKTWPLLLLCITFKFIETF